MTDEQIPVSEEERWKLLFADIKELKSSQHCLKEQIDLFSNLQQSFSVKSADQEKRLQCIEKQLSFNNTALRAKNLILFNLEDTVQINKNLVTVLFEIFKNVGLDIPELALDDAFRLGKFQGKRPVIVKFISSRWVRLAFGKAKQFKLMDLTIANDRTKEEREERKELLGKIRNLKLVGKNVYLKGKRIFLNDKPMDSEEINNVLLSLENNRSIQRHDNESTPGTKRHAVPDPDPIIIRSRGRPRKDRSTNLKKRTLVKNTLDSFVGNATPKGTTDPLKEGNLTRSRRLFTQEDGGSNID